MNENDAVGEGEMQTHLDHATLDYRTILTVNSVELLLNDCFKRFETHEENNIDK